MTASDPIASLADAVQAAEAALAGAETALLAATAVVEQDLPTRYDRMSHHALAVRLAAAERTIARLAAPHADAPTGDGPTKTAPEREYDLECRDPDGTWSWCAVARDDRNTPTGIASALHAARERHPNEQYRAVYRDLPTWTPLTDAELDALVLAEQPGEER